jgi:hypothetical protein
MPRELARLQPLQGQERQELEPELEPELELK